MGASLHGKYLQTSRASKANWAADNRHRINGRRRERRLLQRAARLKGKHCTNCEALLVERLDWSPGRSYLYGRKCLDENRVEARRHRWRRYYYRELGKAPAPKARACRSGPTKYDYLFTDEPTMLTQPQSKAPKTRLLKRREHKGGLVCACGSRYLKTRSGQTRCLHC